jgi:hypothetical protein
MRRVPSLIDRNSWLSGSSSPSARSRAVSNQRVSRLVAAPSRMATLITLCDPDLDRGSVGQALEE